VGRLSERLGMAIRPGPPDCEGLIVKVARLHNEDYPGRGAHGVLPVMVVGHQDMTDAEWAGWVKANAAAPYGVAYAARLAMEGVDLKEMLPTAAIGRQMRKPGGGANYSHYQYISKAGYVLKLVEQWPSLYNLIAEEMGEERMTLVEFVRRIQELPSPQEVGDGRMATLGDLIGRLVTATPDF
jgi:hypothetical protein